MNRIIRLIVASLALVLLSTGARTALAKSYEYERWDVDLTVNRDSTVDVAEAQTFRLDGDFSWVNRILPKTKGIWFDRIEVTDEAGSVLSGVDIADQGDEVEITVHFPTTDASAVTEKTFVFRYRALNALGDFSDHDELYWNAVGPDRDVTVLEATATVRLPDAYEPDQIQQRLLVGPSGSTTESPSYEIVDDSTLRFSGPNIFPGENLTFVAGWPKGAVTFQHFDEPKSTWERIWGWLQWPYYVSPVILFAWLLRKWLRSGRDPKGRSTIIAQYDPPDGSPPAVVGTLVDERADQKDVIATIIDLAVRGYLRIEEEKGTGVFKKTSYTFVKLKPYDGDVALKPFERLLLEALFNGRVSVELDDLKNKFYKDLKKIKESVYEETTRAGYFPRNPDSVRNGYFIAAAIIGFIGFFGLYVFIAWGVLLAIFGAIMPKRTPKGVAGKEWALGFKLYLHTAERYRVKAMTPETFERFLPYAMVFGVEKEWAARFADILKTPPSWFSTNDPTFHFSSVLFASHLASAMNSTVARSLASSPSSSSGFGGGGFSGGGGGGGGGGAG